MKEEKTCEYCGWVIQWECRRFPPASSEYPFIEDIESPCGEWKKDKRRGVMIRLYTPEEWKSLSLRFKFKYSLFRKTFWEKHWWNSRGRGIFNVIVKRNEL